LSPSITSISLYLSLNHLSPTIRSKQNKNIKEKKREEEYLHYTTLK